jgi:hypothetical protein
MVPRPLCTTIAPVLEVAFWPFSGLADVGCPASINSVADIKRALIRRASIGDL